MTNRQKAAKMNANAMALREKGQNAAAVELYERAALLDPGWSVPVYNLGLLYKGERRWAESLDWNQQATALDKKNKEAWWNLGIAATALGRWDVARQAWRGYGIQVNPGAGPVDLPCGMGPIRLNPKGDAEVVWAYRLDPARAEIASIPFPEAGHRWGDIVLNDGAPVGYRKYKGQDVPVLEAIQLLQPSRFHTFVARVAVPTNPKVVEVLAELASKLAGAAEDWTTMTRILCKACSEGRPHKEHDTAAAPPEGTHLIGIAARDHEHATAMLSAWEKEAAEVRVESVEDALAPP